MLPLLGSLALVLLVVICISAQFASSFILILILILACLSRARPLIVRSVRLHRTDLMLLLPVGLLRDNHDDDDGGDAHY